MNCISYCAFQNPSKVLLWVHDPNTLWLNYYLVPPPPRYLPTYVVGFSHGKGGPSHA